MRRRLGEFSGTLPSYGPPIRSSDTISCAFGSSPYASLQIGIRERSKPLRSDRVRSHSGDDHLPQARLHGDAHFHLVAFSIDTPTSNFELATRTPSRRTSISLGTCRP